jgi:hypothetical protein
MDALHDIAHGPDGLELLRVDPDTGELLELHDQIDGVDTVEIEVLAQVCLKRDLVRRDLDKVKEKPGE